MTILVPLLVGDRGGPEVGYLSTGCI